MLLAKVLHCWVLYNRFSFLYIWSLISVSYCSLCHPYYILQTKYHQQCQTNSFWFVVQFPNIPLVNSVLNIFKQKDALVISNYFSKIWILMWSLILLTWVYPKLFEVKVPPREQQTWLIVYWYTFTKQVNNGLYTVSALLARLHTSLMAVRVILPSIWIHCATYASLIVLCLSTAF